MLTHYPNCEAPIGKMVYFYMTRLNDKEKFILDSHTFAPRDKRMTFREIGVCLGISGQRAAQIRDRALKKVTDAMLLDLE